MKLLIFIIIYALVFETASTGLGQSVDEAESRPREPIVGLPCEGCVAVFEGLPDTLSPNARIAPEDEPGEPMRIEGTVYDQEGNPAPVVIVYAYHTDAIGIYPRDPAMRGTAAYRHGKLRAWVKTNEQGHYRFNTIRPSSYPNSTMAAHVHMHIIEVGRCTYYIDSIHFKEDPYLSKKEKKELLEGRGGSGLVIPEKDENGIWQVNRDIHLGENVPGYPGNQDEG